MCDLLCRLWEWGWVFEFSTQRGWFSFLSPSKPWLGVSHCISLNLLFSHSLRTKFGREKKWLLRIYMIRFDHLDNTVLSLHCNVYILNESCKITFVKLDNKLIRQSIRHRHVWWQLFCQCQEESQNPIK